MPPQPTALSLTPDRKLMIEWIDGTRRVYTVRELRDSCPCASCREKRNAPPAPPNPLAILKPAEVGPLELLGMEPVGNYAYAINFSDEHDTGIYTFELLQELGSPA